MFTPFTVRLPASHRLITLVMLMIPLVTHANGEEGLEYFETHIRPLLSEHCYECHSSNAKKRKANLSLDSRVGWQTGGDTGPAIIPGDPENSLLFQAVSHTNGDLEMPPKNRLPDSSIAKLKTWIGMGAPDPRDGDLKPPAPEIDLEEGRQFWSFKLPFQKSKIPPGPPPLPITSSSPASNPQTSLPHPPRQSIPSSAESTMTSSASLPRPRK
jgi:hypothetical protein